MCRNKGKSSAEGLGAITVPGLLWESITDKETFEMGFSEEVGCW